MLSGFSASDAPAKTRRTLTHREAYKTWDYLHHPKNANVDLSVGKANNPNFSKGFQRRQQSSIKQDATRKEYEKTRIETDLARKEYRKSYLTKQKNKHGDIIGHTGNYDEQPQKAHGKRIERKPYDPKESSLGRYYDLGSKDASLERRRAAVAARAANVKQTSSVLGYGRADIPSQGMKDAFMYDAPVASVNFRSSKRSEQTIRAEFHQPKKENHTGLW